MLKGLLEFKDRRVLLELQPVLKGQLVIPEQQGLKDLQGRKAPRVCKVLAQMKQVLKVQQVLQDFSV